MLKNITFTLAQLTFYLMVSIDSIKLSHNKDKRL